MADKSTQLILDALSRAMLEPDGLPLYGSRTETGLFPATTAAKQAAQRCVSEGLLRVTRTENRGKSVQEFCAVTDKGRSYLFKQAHPREVLEDFVRALEMRHKQFDDMAAGVRSAQNSLAALKEAAETVLQQITKEMPTGGAEPKAVAAPSRNGSASTGDPVNQAATNDWQSAVVTWLTNWRGSGTSEDCPLPDLFRHLRQATSALTIGQFHDGLRQLHQRGQIYLHPWTGPLYEMPEPQFALLIGHEIVYYASLRGSNIN